MGVWYNGRTIRLHRIDRGSIPRSSTKIIKKLNLVAERCKMDEVKGKTQTKQNGELRPWERPLSLPVAVPKPEKKKKKGRFSPKETIE